jgi:SlyX protein
MSDAEKTPLAAELRPNDWLPNDSPPNDSPASNSPPKGGATQATVEAHDARLTELEIKLSYSEDLLDSLNQLVAQQQKQIDVLVREVLSLRRQTAEGGSGGFRSLMDEKPPHY